MVDLQELEVDHECSKRLTRASCKTAGVRFQGLSLINGSQGEMAASLQHKERNASGPHAGVCCWEDRAKETLKLALGCSN